MKRIALALLLLLALSAPAQAQLSQSLLTGACDNTNGTSYTTAPITPTIGALTLAAVLVTSEVTATTVSGGGLIWTQVSGANIAYDRGGAFSDQPEL